MYFSVSDMQWYPSEEEPQPTCQCIECGENIYEDNGESTFHLSAKNSHDDAYPFCSKLCAENYAWAKHIEVADIDELS